LARRWPTLAPAEKRALLHALVARIDVRAETVEITVRPAALPEIVRPDRDLRRLPVPTDAPTKTLAVSAKVKRTGMETKLLIQGASGPAHRDKDRSLLRLIGQARRLHDLVMTGYGKTIRQLAAEVGLSPSYFTRIFRLSFLAPEVTRAILQGRQPPELTASKLMLAGKLAPAWPDQRRQLGVD
jgi:site-specific DNA recombinase